MTSFPYLDSHGKGTPLRYGFDSLAYRLLVSELRKVSKSSKSSSFNVGSRQNWSSRFPLLGTSFGFPCVGRIVLLYAMTIPWNLNGDEVRALLVSNFPRLFLIDALLGPWNNQGTRSLESRRRLAQDVASGKLSD